MVTWREAPFSPPPPRPRPPGSPPGHCLEPRALRGLGAPACCCSVCSPPACRRRECYSDSRAGLERRRQGSAMDLSFMAAQVKGSPPRAPHLQIAKFGEIRGLALSKPGSPPGLEPGGDAHGRIPAQPFVTSRAPTWCAFPGQRARLHAQGFRGGSGHCSMVPTGQLWSRRVRLIGAAPDAPSLSLPVLPLPSPRVSRIFPRRGHPHVRAYLAG